MQEDRNIEGIIFNVQRYSLHDGPGIRTTVFLKGCPLHCFWCQNPESQRKQPEISLDKSTCAICGLCVSVCPSGASTLLDGSSTIDRSRCKGCGKCVEVCPNQARKLLGKRVTVDEVMQEVLRDRKFYENSGGGITLSGGEPTAQPEFALAILRSSKREGLHTVLETCGHAPYESLEKLLEYTDLVLFDIKHMDPVRHREATGAANDIILDNARKIARYKPMKVRVPTVPGFNDSPEVIRAIARFARSELGGVEVELLNYNKLGEGKYERLGRACVHLEEKSEEAMKELRDVLSAGSESIR